MSPLVLSIEALIQAPISKVWSMYTDPAHIVNWNFATPEWHCPHAENDLRKDGWFMSRMEARDGSFGFDFKGKYLAVEPFEHLAYQMEDDREVQVSFHQEGEMTRVIGRFEAESSNSPEMQQAGWQAILDNFKAYVEAHS